MSYVELCVSGGEIGSKYPIHVDTASHVAGITKHVYLHALRHTSATLAIKNGTDIHTLKNRLGHENISITSDLYAHLYTGQQQAAAEMMDVYLDS